MCLSCPPSAILVDSSPPTLMANLLITACSACVHVFRAHTLQNSRPIFSPSPPHLLLPCSSRDRKDFTNSLSFWLDSIIYGLSTLPSLQKSVPHDWCLGWQLSVPSLPCSMVAAVVSTAQQPSCWGIVASSHHASFWKAPWASSQSRPKGRSQILSQTPGPPLEDGLHQFSFCKAAKPFVPANEYPTSVETSDQPTSINCQHP